LKVLESIDLAGDPVHRLPAKPGKRGLGDCTTGVAKVGSNDLLALCLSPFGKAELKVSVGDLPALRR